MVAAQLETAGESPGRGPWEGSPCAVESPAGSVLQWTPTAHSSLQQRLLQNGAPGPESSDFHWSGTSREEPPASKLQRLRRGHTARQPRREHNLSKAGLGAQPGGRPGQRQRTARTTRAQGATSGSPEAFPEAPGKCKEKRASLLKLGARPGPLGQARPASRAPPGQGTREERRG